MPRLILSDIHSNAQALAAVLADCEGQYDDVLCCGDVVGYGADPNAVTEWTRSHVQAIVRGNHDKACTGSDEIEWFNPAAKASALWTRTQLEPDHTEWLRGLAHGPMDVGDCQILHGSPVDEDEYLVTPVDVADVAAYLDVSISFFGHTHLQGAFLCHRNGIKQLRGCLPEETEHTIELERDVDYLLNPGAVGQPRDGDPRAAYCLYEPEARLVRFRRVAYDIAEAQQRILAAGLPEMLARRLSFGQ